MPRLPLTLVVGAAAVGLLALPAAAPAEIVELGQTPDRPPASCPADPCQAITRTSGFQVTVGGRDKRGLFEARRDGRVVAFTIRLGNPSRQQIAFFNTNFGGAPQARVSVLKPPTKGFQYQLSGQSELFDLEPYLGREVQFPLLRSLFVRRGYLVVLTTPTWIPAIALGLDRGNAWRSSRSQADCDKQPPPASAQMRLGSLRGYRCLYRGARLTYRATVVAIPRAPKTTSSSPSR
ncbi:MAG: hypothetical protein ABR521_01350 [Gaiellaceae bacterium]